MIKYLNTRTMHGVETVDELDSKNFESHKDFRAELRRLVGEYHMARINVYISSRACKAWN